MCPSVVRGRPSAHESRASGPGGAPRVYGAEKRTELGWLAPWHSSPRHAESEGVYRAKVLELRAGGM